MAVNSSNRPHVTIHMASSVDGRIVSKRWSPYEGDLGYEAVHESLAGDAWMCGRLTMRGYTRGTPADDTDPSPVSRAEDHIVKSGAGSYAIALDFHGRLHWGWRNDIEGDHVVVVVGETVPDQHLNALKASGVSYLFGGRDTLDLALVLDKLARHFGIKRLLVEGGGGINGSFLKAGLVDELSLLLVPAVDGARGIPAVFDTDEAEGAEPVGKGVTLALVSCEPQENGVVRLKYRVTPAG